MKSLECCLIAGRGRPDQLTVEIVAVGSTLPGCIPNRLPLTRVHVSLLPSFGQHVRTGLPTPILEKSAIQWIGYPPCVRVTFDLPQWNRSLSLRVTSR
jgi:hypothetical protein